MWHILWVAVGLLLVAQHLLVSMQAYAIWRSGAETPIQRVARYAVLLTLFWIMSTLLAEILQ